MPIQLESYPTLGLRSHSDSIKTFGSQLKPSGGIDCSAFLYSSLTAPIQTVECHRLRFLPYLRFARAFSLLLSFLFARTHLPSVARPHPLAVRASLPFRLPPLISAPLVFSGRARLTSASPSFPSRRSRPTFSGSPFSQKAVGIGRQTEAPKKVKKRKYQLGTDS